MGQRPGGLTAVCVLTLVMGSMGLLSGLGGLLGLVAGQVLQQSMLKVQPGMDPGMREAQQDMQDELARLTDRFRPFQWARVVGQLLLSMAMIAAAVLALRVKPAGRQALLWALIAALFLTVAQAALEGAVLRLSGPVMQKSIQRIAQQAGPPGQRPPPGFDQMMGGIGQAMVVMQWVVLLGWTALKCAFYLIGAWYLTRPAVVALFARRPEPPSAEFTNA